MQFGKVDIPEPLFDASKAHRLVVFAGAGVSMGVPSCLPSFAGLVDYIACDSGQQQREREPFDQFLGRLERNGVRVHELARERLSAAKSKPTKVHRELLRLFRSPKNIRVVTTNFDRHFSTEAADLYEQSIDHFYAPALPMGDDFSGIVYLHGSVEQEARRLVLTDRDFGEAYLTQGWARRFLQRLFLKYTVLFVGYSHDDTIVSYLARGLPPAADSLRYALDKASNDLSNQREKWEFLGTTPILYPPADGDDAFAELPKILDVWNHMLSMAPSDHEEQIKEYVSVEPGVDLRLAELDPKRETYLTKALKEVPTARFFTNHATHPEWLYWADARGFLDPLFADGDLSEIPQLLANWLAHEFVCNHSEDALIIVQRHHQRFNVGLAQIIMHHLRVARHEGWLRSKVLSKWLTVLLPKIPEWDHGPVLLLNHLSLPEDTEATILLFEHCTAPILRLRGPTARVEIQLTTDSAYILDKAWNEVLQPHLPDLASSLLPIVTRHFQHARRLLVMAEEGHGPHWDSISMHRSAIEPHDQDRHRQTMDSLIDAARDIIEWLGEYDAPRARRVIEEWATSQTPLLERLALHGLAESPHIEADTIIDWLLQRDWFYELWLKHEVFRLLAKAYPEASQWKREQLLERVIEGPQTIEDDRDAYPVYNLLYWLHKKAPECVLAREAFEKIQAQHPRFIPREHPDFDFWMGEGGFVDHSEEVQALLNRSPEEVAAEIAQEQYRPSDAIREAIETDFEWGFQLAQALAAHNSWQEGLWESLLLGLRSASIDEKQWEPLLDFLIEHTEIHSHTRTLASFLEARAKPDEGDLPTPVLEKALQLADRLWDVASKKDTDPADYGADLATVLLNEAGAQLSIFYLYALWHVHEEASGIPLAFKQRFERILTSHSQAGQAGQMMLAGRLSFLFGQDPAWTKAHLFRLLDWADAESARGAWTGISTFGRISQPLFVELRPLYKETFAHVIPELADSRKQFAGMVADLCFTGWHDPLDDEWLPAFISAVEDEDRVNWIYRVNRRLEELDEESVQAAWSKWLRTYWERRVQGKPLPLSEREKEIMVEWIFHLDPVLNEALDLMTKPPPPAISDLSMLLLRLGDAEISIHHPQGTARLLQYILEGQDNFPSYSCKYLCDLIERLAAAGEVEKAALSQLIEQCIELGCMDSSDKQRLL